jgi:hypothetical protein
MAHWIATQLTLQASGELQSAARHRSSDRISYIQTRVMNGSK